MYGAQCVLSISRWRQQGNNVVKMIKGVQAVKGELSRLDKQLSDAFLHEVSLILFSSCRV